MSASVLSVSIIESIIDADPSADTIDENLRITKNGRLGGKDVPLSNDPRLVAEKIDMVLRQCAFSQEGQKRTLRLEDRDVILARLKKWEGFLNLAIRESGDSSNFQLGDTAAHLPILKFRSPSSTLR